MTAIKIGKERPPVESLGQGEVFRVASVSRPGLFHYIVRFPNEQGTRCSCEGWSNHGHCWHVLALPPVKPVPENKAPQGDVVISQTITDPRLIGMGSRESVPRFAGPDWGKISLSTVSRDIREARRRSQRTEADSVNKSVVKPRRWGDGL